MLSVYIYILLNHCDYIGIKIHTNKYKERDKAEKQINIYTNTCYRTEMTNKIEKKYILMKDIHAMIKLITKIYKRKKEI